MGRPKVSYVEADTAYIGIDPGAGGGLAFLTDGVVSVVKTPATDADLWNWFAGLVNSRRRLFAVLEKLTPRPAMVFDWELKKVRPRILKSTCLLYASYVQMRSFLTAAGIPFEEATPQAWQKGLGVPPKKKGEKDGPWKNRLKAKAQQLFPGVRVTLATADALLIAEYCKRSRRGG